MSWLSDRAQRRQAEVDRVTAELRGDPPPMNFAGVATPTWRERLLRTLFPTRPLPEMTEMPAGYVEGYLESVAIVHVNWPDRLRLLLAGSFTVITRHKTDVRVNHIFSRSVFWVEPARKP